MTLVARPTAAADRTVRGSLHAVFRVRDAGVEVTRTSTPPLELRGPFLDGTPGASPRYFLRNVTSGVFGGDRYEVSVRVEAGARVRVQPTAATKVYNALGETACAVTRIEVMPGGTLDYDAGTTILQAGANLEQTAELLVHPGGALRYTEVLALGRAAAGERLAFERFASSLDVRAVEGATRYREAYELVPASGRTDIEQATGGAAVVGTLVILGGPTEIAPGVIEAEPTVLAGWGTLPGGGVIVRALGATTQAVTRLLARTAR
jgi:urease accessory protein